MIEFPRHLGLILMGMLLSLSPRGAAVTLTTDDATGSSSFNSAGMWSDGAAPSGTNDYVDTGHTLRTPSTLGSNGSITFAGNSLTISGGAFAYKGTNANDVVTVNSLILNSGVVVGNWAGLLLNFTLAGHISLGTGGAHFDINGNDPFTVTAAISGSGPLQITASMISVQATNAIILKSTNTYTGGTTVTALSYLDVQADGALGTGNLTVTGGQLKLDSGTTNNYIADSASVILSSSLASGAVDLAFTGSDTVAKLSLDGGSTFAAAGTWGATGSGAQFTSSLFSGSGTLTVVPEAPTWALLAGSGGLLLALRRRRRALLPS